MWFVKLINLGKEKLYFIVGVVLANTKRKKNTRSKKKSRTTKQLSLRLYGALALAFSVIGFLDLGFLGTLFSNMMRIVVGNVYQLGLIGLALVGIYWLLFDQRPKLKANYWLGSILVILGILLFISAYAFASSEIHSDFLTVFFKRAGNELVSGSLNEDLAGGFIGVALYSLSYFLMGQVGSYILSGVLIFLGGMLLFQISFATFLEKLGQLLKQFVAHVRNVFKELVESFAEDEDEKRTNSPKEQSPMEPEIQIAPKKDPVQVTTQKTVETPIKIAEPTKKVVPQVPKQKRTSTANPDYELPTIELLSDLAQPDRALEKEKIKQNQQVLTETLKSFGVQAELKNIILGPAVTKYELHPAIGVKVSKFVSLADDLALALAAKDIRIEAPIPGKALVGIEVPNQNVAAVSFKELMNEFRTTDFAPLEVPLGRDISNGLITADLAKMPHLLIAGSTGSGKSVAINVILTSILMNCEPDQVKLVLIDPKKVELGMYHDLPHLMTPVVTEPRKAAVTLDKVVNKMQQRYEEFARTGQRNLDGYNKLAQKEPQNYEKMPYIVVVVDELADLMMTTGNEVEAAITRIAQMGRAAGIHLILATQRPSVDVITGIIKANVPSRMAFAVSSGTDSRTIIDQVGAEKLLGRGDMLYLPMGQNKPTRVQGAFIPDEDVQNVVDFIKEQSEVVYDEELEVSADELTKDDNGSEDELFDQVVEFITREQKCSVSLLQRHFRIGYQRASRIVEELENHGFIGPQNGAKSRQVYLKASSDEEDHV